MQVHRDLAQLPAFRSAIVTIGTFDGVHAGHRQIIDLMKREAQEHGGETVLITFHPHPREVVQLEGPPIYLLTTLEEKMRALDEAGLDHLVVVPFHDAFANQSAEAYITQFLVARFQPRVIVIGHDHRYGKNRAGDFALLQRMAPGFGFTVMEIPAFMLEEITISSTRIRESLLAGAVSRANQLLSYPYFFCGQVVQGNQLGRTIGFPTANLHISDTRKLVPANGVYAVEVDRLTTGERLQGMMNIGIRPTVSGTQRMIEVNIFDFDAMIYDETLRVHVHHRLRDEQKFQGLDALKAQLAEDARQARELLAAI